MVEMAGIVDLIFAYENGEMDEEEVIDFFQRLLDTGIINHLQGSYQRMAMEFMRSGLIGG